MRVIFSLLALSVAQAAPLTQASAYEVVEVCAKYLGTGKSYVVESKVYSGSELNQRTKSYNYNSFSTHGVIFWGPEQASVIELDFSIGNKISPYGSTGKDQRGYRWELSTSTMFCN